MNKFKLQKVKFVYYLTNTLRLLVPRMYYRLKIESELNKIDLYNHKEILFRVNYYNKLKKKFVVSNNAVSNKEFWIRQKNILYDFFIKKNKSRKKMTTYFYDLYNIFSFFPINNKLDFKFGDVRDSFPKPIIVKSRPIRGNENSTIMKLESVRHFNFINDNRSFIDKSNKAVWRGYPMNNEKRLLFIKNYHHVPIFDIGQSNPVTDEPWYKGYMSIYDQLANKFIFCIEGWDTATSMKWVMSSNSVCVMPKPKYETWFMEGVLRADVHYVEVSDDFSDAEEKVKYYSRNADKSLKIIENAHSHIEQFKNPGREKLISLLVLDKYFALSDQNAQYKIEFGKS
mgnify:FL=1